MTENEKIENNVLENMDKKHDTASKGSTPRDDDTESGEDHPLDIGIHYLAQRADETWRTSVS